MPKDIIGTSRAKLNDLLGQRADLLAAAEGVAGAVGHAGVNVE